MEWRQYGRAAAHHNVLLVNDIQSGVDFVRPEIHHRSDVLHCAGDRRPGHLSQGVSLVGFQLPPGERHGDLAEPGQFRLELANSEAHDERGDHDRRPRAGQDRREGRPFAHRLGLQEGPPPRELARPHRRVGVRREHEPGDKRRERPLSRPLWPRECGRVRPPSGRGHVVDAAFRPALGGSPFGGPARAWLARNRRLAKDYEARPQTTDVLMADGMIGLMLRRLTRRC